MEHSKNLETHLNEIKSTRQSSDRVLSCMHYVVMVARRYARGDVELLQDYIQDGYEGLLRADKKFDETRGIKFLTFAAWYVRAYIQQGQRKHAFCVAAPQTNVYQNTANHHLLPKKVDLDDWAVDGATAVEFELEPDWDDVFKHLPLGLRQYLALMLKVNKKEDLERITGECRSTVYNNKKRILEIMERKLSP